MSEPADSNMGAVPDYAGMRERAEFALSNPNGPPGVLAMGQDVLDLLTDREYAWSCAEDMKRWAQRAEEKTKAIREEGAARDELLKEALADRHSLQARLEESEASLRDAKEQETYAWECAENMRGWAQRAEESLKQLREEYVFDVHALRSALRLIAYQPFDVNASAVSDLAEAKNIASAALAALPNSEASR